MSDGELQLSVGHGDATQLYSQVTWQLGVLEARIEAHRARARSWDIGAKLIAFVLTVTAGVSALTIVADHVAVATAFAVVTAVFTAANSVFGPAETAKQHRDAAAAYERAIFRLGEVATATQPSTQFDPSTQRYEWRPSLTGAELAAGWRDAETVRREVLDIGARAPLVDWESIHRRNARDEELAWERERLRSESMAPASMES